MSGGNPATRWRWILPQTVLAIHDAQLAEHGGLPGLRDLGLLESALARPRNLLAHAAQGVAPPDAFDLAAAYAYGLARNHAFIDGNKRTAYVVCCLFLLLHGCDMAAPDVERVLVFERLGKGEVTERELAGWLRG
ncbi:MAG: type II toxin-antitoxin system death-on-curing family toxin [Humidesulfovibrio sp.]|jgi:death-on-curing protein|uniref:type II toxin-antitoxin system death-on-curing family toxin n=1 Tax=Humidesulfovibrio sp. TaxID=2910988 RepID=UPI002735D559|nr:type II toxin-antitoxin system death-on-curing family toxin [Humidesulfovibrio sp.]MDP2848193.1 type II toxin-antitoxin system death-on-curing family toxin [Humidesulfovibrio sp.]